MVERVTEDWYYEMFLSKMRQDSGYDWKNQYLGIIDDQVNNKDYSQQEGDRYKGYLLNAFARAMEELEAENKKRK